MSNWISKHLSTCFLTVIGLIILLTIVFNIRISKAESISNSKIDTLILNRAMIDMKFSMDEISAKQDIIINNQNILLHDK